MAPSEALENVLGHIEALESEYQSLRRTAEEGEVRLAVWSAPADISQCNAMSALPWKADIRTFAQNLTSERIASDKCRCRICGKTDFADRRFRKSSLSSQFGCPLSLSKISALP